MPEQTIVGLPADNRLGGRLGGKPLRFIWVLDVSGSMAADGKIQALNVAVNEAIPHLRMAATHNPGTELQMQALAFATTLRWAVPDPTPLEGFRWNDLAVEHQGRTELGLALREISGVMRTMAEVNRGYAPVIVLVSDGQPTNLSDPSFRDGLAELRAEPWGDKAMRLAIGIGRDADTAVLQEFIGNAKIAPMLAENPHQLVAAIKFASTLAVRSSGNSRLLESASLAGAREAVAMAGPSDAMW